MRKILGILIVFFALTSYTYGNWYNNHSVVYTPTNGVRSCDNDGDNTGGGHPTYGHFAVADNNSSTSLSPETVLFPLGTSGTIRCLHWDGSNPEEVAVSYTDGYESTSQSINVSAKDRGGSRLRHMYLYESQNGGAFTLVSSWINLTAPTNTTVSRTFTRTAIPGNTFSYRVIAHDYAGATTTYTNTAVLSFDGILPTTDVTYATGIAKTPVTITAQGRDTGGSRLEGIYLYESVDGAAYSLATSWTSLSDPDDTLVTRTWSDATPLHGSTVRYRTTVFDYAGNSRTYTNPGTITYDLLPPTPVISSTTHVDGGWSADTDPIMNISATPYFNYYCNDTTDTCDPGTAGDSESYSGLSDGQHYFRAKTCNLGTCTPIVSYEILIDSVAVSDPTITSSTHVDDVWTSNDDPEFTVTPAASTAPITNQYCINAAGNCTPGTPGDSRTFINVPDGDYYFRAISCKFSGCSAPVSYYIKIDTIAPSVTDIGASSPVSGENLLATDSQYISVNVSDGGASPITSVRGYFEDYSNAAGGYITTPFSSSNGLLAIQPSIELVDNDGSPSNGVKQYSYKITNVCDEAGNCNTIGDNSTSAAGIVNYTYNAFADINNIASSSITTGEKNALESIGNIADGTSFPITLSLEDIYGNNIVPNASINRQVDFSIAAQNSVYLNQYQRIGNSAVQISTPASGSSYSQYPITLTAQDFTNQPSTDGTYSFDFRSYAPTNHSSSTHGSDPASAFIINGLSVDVSDDIGSSSASITIPDDGEIDFTFLPMFSNQFGGSLDTDGLLDGLEQSSSLQVTKHSSLSLGTASSRRMYLKYNGNASATSSYVLYYDQTTPPISTVSSSSALSSRIPTGFFGTSPYSLYSRLEQTSGAPVDALDSAFLSSHMTYTINGYDVILNGDVIGKDNYHDPLAPGLINYAGVKIVGISNTDKAQEYVSGQFPDDIRIIGKLTKSSFRRDIRKRAFELVRNISPNVGANTVDDFTDVDGWESSNDGVHILGNSVLYYGDMGGEIVTLGNSITETIDGNKTVVVLGGDIYITSNLEYRNSSDMLGLISLEDDNGDGGNIYIHPDVTDISAVLYADKSIMTAIDNDGNDQIAASEQFSGLSDPADFSDQLYILGSLFSENTIGGARAVPRECPYYVASCLTGDVAQKYDLNYIRRYILEDHDNDPGTPDIPAHSGQQSAGATGYEDYPLIIEYNPALQSSPPPLFK